MASAADVKPANEGDEAVAQAKELAVRGAQPVETGRIIDRLAESSRVSPCPLTASVNECDAYRHA